MKNPITTLHIQNFKTIKDLKVKCKRINIIIGKPNVGKSNFLEAVSLLGGTYSTDKNKFLSEFVRYNKFEDLFYDKEFNNRITVNTNIGVASISSKQDEKVFRFILGPTLGKVNNVISEYPGETHLNIDLANSFPGKTYKKTDFPFTFLEQINSTGIRKEKFTDWLSPVKKYEFQKGIESTNRFHEFLWPPYGNNIFTIVNRKKGLLNEIAGFFKEYKLKFGLRMEDTSFEVRKQVGHYVYPTAFNLIADTLQRMIFNITGIESNKESILLFEEPEAHSFPPYVKMFAEKVIESKTNQFFITTHSPFILNTIIENTPLDEVAIFKATYDKFETKMSELPKSRIEAMLDYGNDIFFSPELSR